ncbi:MAG: DNA methyltransferase [Mycobacteriales bacterium]
MKRHPFHALCPYFAMFPESFVEHWVSRLTEAGDTVLDPFCGRGTTPFQSILMDRHAIANDINPVAYCVSKAKTNAPSLPALRSRITRLAGGFDRERWATVAADLPEFFQHAYAPLPLAQLCYLREGLSWRQSSVDAMVAALILGRLHGEMDRSPRYLSNQMPRTISTKPDYSVRWWQARKLRPPDRDAFALLRAEAAFRYVLGTPTGVATVLLGDMRSLPTALKNQAPVKLVVTSPPYLDVTSFEEDQWLRLWFLGGPAEPHRSRISRDDRHDQRGSYWLMIADLWRALGPLVEDKGHVVVRIGGKGLTAKQLVDGLEGTSNLSRRKVRLKGHTVSPIKGRQTRTFARTAAACADEVDCHFVLT